MAAHAVNDTVRWIEHDVWILYGNISAEAPEVDDTYKPMFDLTSTNGSWVYTSFTDATNLRPGSWVESVTSTAGKTSTTYTGSHTADADPATEMGMSILAYLKSGKWTSENATIEWRLSNPCGIATVTSAGEKYRVSSSWPALAALQSTLDGRKWVSEWNETSPASATTWTAWTHNSEAIGTGATLIRFVLSGAVSGTTDNAAHFETQSATVALATDKWPSVTLSAQQTNYNLDCKITSSVTGEYITVTYPMITNKTIIVDTDAKTVKADGNSALAALRKSSIRKDWLLMSSGVANTFTFDQTGTGNVTIVIKWQDRASA